MSKRATQGSAKARGSSEPAGEKGKRFFTPEDLHRFAREDPKVLLEAALMQVQQLMTT